MASDRYEQDHPGGIVWIPEGQRFTFDDIVTFARKGQVAFEDAAHSIDLILTGAHERGALTFARIRDQVIETVFERKCAYLHRLPVETMTMAKFHSAQMLHVQCVHDTMNTKALPDGAIAKPRESEADLLPTLVALSNGGDGTGEPRPRDDGQAMAGNDVTTISGAQLRAVRRAYQFAHGIGEAALEANICLNRPYLGSYEIQLLGPRLREMAERATIRHQSGAQVLRLTTGVYQAEYLREYLLGARNTQAIKTPGEGWPEADPRHIESVAARLKESYEALRLWGVSMS